MGSLCIGGYFGKVSEMPDTAIKLFGKTIALPLPVSHEEEGGGDDTIANKGSPTKEITTETKDEDREAEPGNGDPLTSSPAHEHDQENSPEKDANADEQHSDSGEKLLKKPDKVLPCPRCNSMDTKFCYYNNYNVNQPRHFCKNCQRYWTAGGTMRNVPVGAGRRKSKNSVHYPTLKPNGTALSFGSNAHLAGSMALVLDLGEKNMMNCNPVEEKSAGFSIEEGNAANSQGFAPHFVRPYPWTPPPFYPSSAYWGCSNLSGPWISLQSGPNSPTLGKHSRDGHVLTKLGNNNSNKQGNLWIPKTFRIDDPEEAARSSIWATMGFKNGKDDCGGLFKDFNNLKVKANSQVLLANPAALSRSSNFQERS